VLITPLTCCAAYGSATSRPRRSAPWRWISSAKVRQLDRRIAKAADDIQTAVTASCTTLTDVYGVGALTAAKILAHVGAVGRFRSAAAFRQLHRHRAGRGVLRRGGPLTTFLRRKPPPELLPARHGHLRSEVGLVACSIGSRSGWVGGSSRWCARSRSGGASCVLRSSVWCRRRRRGRRRPLRPQHRIPGTRRLRQSRWAWLAGRAGSRREQP
jgi:hypothetical protein